MIWRVKARFGPDAQGFQVWAKKPPCPANVDSAKRFPFKGTCFPFNL